MYIFVCVCIPILVKTAQRYRTLAAHTRGCASILVFIVFYMHMHSSAGLIRWTPPPTFSDTAITDRHSDTTIFQLGAHWVTEPDKLRIFINYTLKMPEYECLSNFSCITYCCHFSAYARGFVLILICESRSVDTKFGVP